MTVFKRAGSAWKKCGHENMMGEPNWQEDLKGSTKSNFKTYVVGRETNVWSLHVEEPIGDRASDIGVRRAVAVSTGILIVEQIRWWDKPIGTKCTMYRKSCNERG